MQLRPPVGTPTLPQELEPSVMVPENVRKQLGDRGVDEIPRVVAYDGSGRAYQRAPTRF
jgi:hypothetical protein